MSSSALGPLALGTVLGYVTHYLLRRDPTPGAHDLAGIVASLASGLVLDAVGGPERAHEYFVGLALGFGVYWLALRWGGERTEGPRAGSSGSRPRLLPRRKRSGRPR